MSGNFDPGGGGGWYEDDDVALRRRGRGETPLPDEVAPAPAPESAPVDTGLGIPAADLATYQAIVTQQAQPQVGPQEYGPGDDAGYAPEAPPEVGYQEYGPQDQGYAEPAYAQGYDVADEWGGNDPGQGPAYAQPDWSGGFADEWGGNDPGQATTWTSGFGEDPYAIQDVDPTYSGPGQEHYGDFNRHVASRWNPGATVDWDPGARAPDTATADFLAGFDPRSGYAGEQNVRQGRDIAASLQDTSELQNYLYTQGAADWQGYQGWRASVQADQHNQELDDWQFQQDKANWNLPGQAKAYDQYDQSGRQQQAAWESQVADFYQDKNPYDNPEMFGSQATQQYGGAYGAGPQRPDWSGQVRQAGDDFDRYVALIRQGHGFDQATRGFSDAERLQLWTAGQAADDPAHLAQVRQSWVDAHAGSDFAATPKYLNDPAGAAAHAAFAPVRQGTEALMALPNPVIQKVDGVLRQVPGVAGASEQAYALATRLWQADASEIDPSAKGPIMAYFASLGLSARAISEIAMGWTGALADGDITQAREAGKRYAAQNPDFAWVAEQVANALLFEAGAHAARPVTHPVAAAAGRQAGRVDSALGLRDRFRPADPVNPIRTGADVPWVGGATRVDVPQGRPDVAARPPVVPVAGRPGGDAFPVPVGVREIARDDPRRGGVPGGAGPDPMVADSARGPVDAPAPVEEPWVQDAFGRWPDDPDYYPGPEPSPHIPGAENWEIDDLFPDPVAPRNATASAVPDNRLALPAEGVGARAEIPPPDYGPRTFPDTPPPGYAADYKPIPDTRTLPSETFWGDVAGVLDDVDRNPEYSPSGRRALKISERQGVKDLAGEYVDAMVAAGGNFTPGVKAVADRLPPALRRDLDLVLEEHGLVEGLTTRVDDRLAGGQANGDTGGYVPDDLEQSAMAWNKTQRNEPRATTPEGKQALSDMADVREGKAPVGRPMLRGNERPLPQTKWGRQAERRVREGGTLGPSTVRNLRFQERYGEVAQGDLAPYEPYASKKTGETRRDRQERLLDTRGQVAPRANPNPSPSVRSRGASFDNADLAAGWDHASPEALLPEYDARVARLQKTIDRIDALGIWDKGDGTPHWEGGTGDWQSGAIKVLDEEIAAAFAAGDKKTAYALVADKAALSRERRGLNNTPSRPKKMQDLHDAINAAREAGDKRTTATLIKQRKYLETQPGMLEDPRQAQPGGSTRSLLFQTIGDRNALAGKVPRADPFAAMEPDLDYAGALAGKDEAVTGHGPAQGPERMRVRGDYPQGTVAEGYNTTFGNPDTRGAVPARDFEVRPPGEQHPHEVVPPDERQTVTQLRPRRPHETKAQAGERVRAEKVARDTSVDAAHPRPLLGPGHIKDALKDLRRVGNDLHPESVGPFASKVGNALKAATKDKAFAGLASGAPSLTISDDDDDTTRNLKIAAGALGLVSVIGFGYRGLRSSPRAKRLVAPATAHGTTGVPGVSPVQTKTLTKQAQKYAAVQVTRGYLAPHLEDIASRYTKGPAFIKQVEALIDGTYAPASRTARQTQLAADVAKMFQGIGPQVKRDLPAIYNRSGGVPDLFTKELMHSIGEHLEAKIGPGVGLRPGGQPKGLNPERVMQAVKRPYAEAILHHNPGWGVVQALEGGSKTVMSATLDQVGKEFRAGGAAKVREHLDDPKSGWTHDPYLDDTASKGTGLSNQEPILKWALPDAVRAGTGMQEVWNKTWQYAQQASSYLNTAMARELGTETVLARVGKYISPGNDAFAGAPKGRLEFAKGIDLNGKSLAERLDGVTHKQDYVDIVDGFQAAGKITAAQARDLKEIFASHQADAHQYGLGETRANMRDYAFQTNVDRAIGSVVPFHYWITHNLAFTARMAAKHPKSMVALAAAAAYTIQENKDLPNWAKMSVRFPARALADKNPNPAMRKLANAGLDAAFGKGADPRLNLWAEFNPAIADIAKGIDKGDYKKLIQAWGDPSTAAQLVKLANDFGYHAGPQYDTFGRAAQAAGGLPAWLAALTAEPFQGMDWAGSTGQAVRGVAGSIPGVERLPRAVNRAVAGGHDYSGLEQEGIAEKGGDSRAYFRQKALQQGLYALGLRGPQVGDANGSDDRDKGAKLPNETSGLKARQIAYFLAYPPKDPRTGEDLTTAPGYWDRYNAATGTGTVPDDTLYAGNPDVQKARKKAVNNRFGADLPNSGEAGYNAFYNQSYYGAKDKALADAGLPVPDQKSASYGKTPYSLGGGLAMGTQATKGEEDAQLQALWQQVMEDYDNAKRLKDDGFFARPQERLGGLSPAQFQLRYRGDGGDDPGSQPGTFGLPKGLGGGLVGAADTSAKIDPAAREKLYQNRQAIFATLKAFDNDAERWDYLHSVYGNGQGKTVLQVLNSDQTGSDYQPVKEGASPDLVGTDNLTDRQRIAMKAAQDAYRAKHGDYLKAGQPGSTPAYREAWYAGYNAIATRFGAVDEGTGTGVGRYVPPDKQRGLSQGGGAPSASSSGTPAATGPASAPPAAGTTSATRTASPPIPSRASVAPTRSSTSTPARTSVPPVLRTTSVAKVAAPATRPAAPKSSTSSSGARATVPSAASPRPSGGSWLGGFGRPSGSPLSGGTSAPGSARPLEPGVAAKDTAAAYNAWQARADAGKATIDEAYAIVARHAQSGGNPAPYVKRMKYSVYTEIRDYRGTTRQEGDQRRGEWFAAVKALPDDLAGAKALAAIEREVRGGATKKVAA